MPIGAHHPNPNAEQSTLDVIVDEVIAKSKRSRESNMIERDHDFIVVIVVVKETCSFGSWTIVRSDMGNFGSFRVCAPDAVGLGRVWRRGANPLVASVMRLRRRPIRSRHSHAELRSRRYRPQCVDPGYTEECRLEPLHNR